MSSSSILPNAVPQVGPTPSGDPEPFFLTNQVTPIRRRSALGRNEPATARGKRHLTIEQLNGAIFPKVVPATPDLFIVDEPSLISKSSIDRIAGKLRQPARKASSRGAPAQAAPASIQTDLRALEKSLFILQARAASFGAHSLSGVVLERLLSGESIGSSYAEWAARCVLVTVAAARPASREYRRYHKMLCLLMTIELPALSQMLLSTHTKQSVSHRTPLGVSKGAPALMVDDIALRLASCDMRGLRNQAVRDYIAPSRSRYQDGDDRELDKYFVDFLADQMAAYTEACERVLEDWLTGQVIFPKKEVLFAALTLILLRGTNYSVILRSRLFWNSKANSYELRSRKARSGYSKICLPLGGCTLADALTKLRTIRKGASGRLLAIWDGSQWCDIDATQYTKWLNNDLPVRRSNARTSPCQFRTTVAQQAALTPGQGIGRACQILDHQSVKQTIEYVDSPYFRLNQDRAAARVLQKICALAVSPLGSATLMKLGMEAEAVEIELQRLAVSLGLAMPATCSDHLLSVSVIPPTPACDRKKKPNDGMPLATAGDTAALLGRAAHFAIHNMSKIIESAHCPQRDKHTEVVVSVLSAASGAGLDRAILLDDALQLLSTSIHIVLTFSGIEATAQPHALRATPFFEAGTWRLSLGKNYVKPISIIAAAVIAEYTRCLDAISPPLQQELFRGLAVSSKDICNLLTAYGLPGYWHLESGHANNRFLFSPKRLALGMAYLWWVTAERNLSAFAYQTGDHRFSKNDRLLPKIERAWVADPAGPYAQKVIPKYEHVFARQFPPIAANENQSPDRRVTVGRRRLPMHDYGENRGEQLDKRIYMLNRILDGSMVKDDLPCENIQAVLHWGCEAEGITPLKTKSLTGNHHLHGHRIQQIKLLLAMEKKSGPKFRGSQTVVKQVARAPMALPPSVSAVTVETPPGSGTRSTVVASNWAGVLLGFAAAEVQVAGKSSFAYGNDHANRNVELATKAGTTDALTESEHRSSPIAGLPVETPPGSGTGLTRAARELLSRLAAVSSTEWDKVQALQNFMRFLSRRHRTLVNADVPAGLHAATPDDVNAWKAEMSGHGLAPSTINKYLARARRALAELDKLESDALVPATDQIIAEARQAVDRSIRMPRRAVPTDAQVRAIYRQLGLSRNGVRNQVLFACALATSARVGEIPRLRPRLSQPGSGLASCTFVQKGGSVRTVSVPTSLAELMWELQSSTTKSDGGAGAARQVQIGDGPIFMSRSGIELSSDQMSRIVSAAARKVGTPESTIHRARASNFTWAFQIIGDANDDVLPDSAAIVSGHAMIKTTKRHYLARRDEQASLDDCRDDGVSRVLVSADTDVLPCAVRVSDEVRPTIAATACRRRSATSTQMLVRI